jgi:hypothetical protein
MFKIYIQTYGRYPGSGMCVSDKVRAYYDIDEENLITIIMSENKYRKHELFKLTLYLKVLLIIILCKQVKAGSTTLK